MKFVGLTLEDEVPDNSVLSRFRTELTTNKPMILMDMINSQLEGKGILLKKGAVVDASITDSPCKPRGKEGDEMVEDRKEHIDADEQPPIPPTIVLAVQVQSHVDTQAAWIKKAGRLRLVIRSI